MSELGRNTDELQIAKLLDEYTTAIRQKDAEATVACYAADVVAYDLAPPLVIGANAMRDPGHLQMWFDTWNGPIESTPHDLTICVGGDIAYAFGLRHMTGTKTSGEAIDLWFRATACFVRRGEGWKISHVHNSVPFAMDGSGKARLDLKP